MAFIFSTSHLPETRARRPDHLEEEEDEDSMSPPPRAGMVRAFSHLPAKEETADPAGPLSQRGAQVLGRQLQRTETRDTSTPHADGISAAKASGVFDVVRQQFNRDDSPHFMDEDGNLRLRDQTRQQDSPAPRDARSPQFGAGAPTRPAWSTGHAAAADEHSSRSPRAPSPAPEDTRPWHTPAITPEDLDPHHFDEDDATAGSHSAPKDRPGAHDLVYRIHGESKPKPEFQDFLHRLRGSPEEAKDHRSDYVHNVAAAADARGNLTQQSNSYGAAPDNRGNAGNSSFGSPLASTAPSSPPLTTQDVLDLADKSELGAAKRQFKALLAEQQRISKELADAREVLKANQDNIKSLEELRLVLKGAKKGYERGKKPLPKPAREILEDIMKKTGADPAAQIERLEEMIKESEARTAGNERAIQQAEEAYRQALKATQGAGQRMRALEEQKNRPPVPSPAPTPVPSPSPTQQYKLPTQPWT